MKSRYDTPYTASHSVVAHLRISYLCKYCNHRNIDDSNTIKLEEKYEPGCHDLLGVDSGDEAKQMLQEDAKRVCKDIKQKRYSKLKLKCHCENCGKAPLWAFYSRFSNFSAIMLLFGCAFLWIIPYTLVTFGTGTRRQLDNSDLVLKAAFILFPLVWMIPKAIDLIRKAIRKRKIRQMDKRYLPEICLLKEGDRPVSADDPFFKLPTISRDISANEWKCPRCGRINRNYVGTCGCGKEKPDR